MSVVALLNVASKRPRCCIARIMAVIAFAASSACERAAPPSGSYVTIDTLENGAVRVRNSGLAEAAASRGTLVEDLRIGSVEGPGPDVFGRIVGLEVDEDGRIYVLDALARELRIFSRDGEHVRTVGRGGSGPGEFLRAMGMARDPEGRLWVVDSGNRRYTLFDSEGDLLSHVPREWGSAGTHWPGTVDGSGHVWEELRLSRPAVVLTGVTERLLGRVSSRGELLDTIPLPRHQHSIIEAGGVVAVIPFTSTQVWAVDREGALWLGMTGEYRLVQLQPPADTVMIIEKDAQPVFLSAAERQALLEADAGLRAVRQQGGVLDPNRMPAQKPAFTRFVPARDGTIWVWRSTGMTDSVLIDVFEGDGRQSGVIVSHEAILPPPPVIDQDYLVGVVADAVGVQNVVRFRIVRQIEP